VKKLTGFIITAGHLDIEWYQPLRSFRFWTVEALEDLIVAAERDDFVCYVLDGQVFPLEEYLEVVPEDEGTMRQLVKSGKLAIGPFYTQFDEWLPSAENMIRNCLWGKRRGEFYGGWMRAGYLPDNFGHPRQMPQILNGFGIDSLMFMRGMPEVDGGHPDEFIYEGLDGSRVLVTHFRESYSGAFDIFKKPHDPHQHREVPYYPYHMSYEMFRELAVHDEPERIAKTLIENAYRIAPRYPSGVLPLISGYDHLPPQINVGESVKLANEMQDEIEFVIGNAEEYVKAVYANLNTPKVYDMELIGSAYHHILLGALSTRGYLKRQNFGCEALLERYAEPLIAYASRYGYREKRTLLREAWRYLLINSAHDSIHGSSTDEVHIEMEARFGAARQIAAGSVNDAFAYIGRRARRWWTEGLDRGILAYAPVDARHEQAAEVWLPIGNQDLVIRDESGRVMPTQILSRQAIPQNGIGLARNDAFPNEKSRKILFMDAMSAGRALIYATAARKRPIDTPLKGGDDFIENEYLRVMATGGLLRIEDKLSGKTYHNLNLLEEEADAGDAWDYSPPWVPGETVLSSGSEFTGKLMELGEVRAVLMLDGTINVPSCLEGDARSKARREMAVTFEIILYRGCRRADVRLALDNTAKDHRIRLRIPTGVRTKTVLSQGHLAIIERPIQRQREIDKWVQPPTQLVPCREWVAACDERHGLAVALRGLYDYEATINPLNAEADVHITLLRGIGLMGRRNTLNRRGAASDANEVPGAQCLGEQVVEWAYVPYEVDPGDKAPFLRTVQAYLYPPAAHMVRSNPEKENFEFDEMFGWDENNIQFSALKKCEEGDGYILRVFENQGIRTHTRLRVGGFAKAWITNMDEKPLEPLTVADGCVSLTIEPYKAATIKLVI